MSELKEFKKFVEERYNPVFGSDLSVAIDEFKTFKANKEKEDCLNSVVNEIKKLIPNHSMIINCDPVYRADCYNVYDKEIVGKRFTIELQIEE